ncbi:MAG: tetratricopeptide repeat protein [Cyanobacteria bacterium SIG30]|nr:tetratricopeptide repeat protein [Cyanobacteria bacterium SIG30]
MEYNICEEYIQIIRSKIKNGEYDKAIISANKVIDYSPEFAMAYYLRGICYYANGDFISAIGDYAFATAFSNDFAKAYFNMGVAKYKLKKYDDAIVDINTALEIFNKKNDQIAARKCVESLDIIKQEKL